jgi:hypothetical protein
MLQLPFSPDYQSQVARTSVGEPDERARRWELETGRALRALQGHAASVKSECCTLASDWALIVGDAGGVDFQPRTRAISSLRL